MILFFCIAISEKKFSFEQAKELDRLNERRPNTKNEAYSSNILSKSSNLTASKSVSMTPSHEIKQTSIDTSSKEDASVERNLISDECKVEQEADNKKQDFDNILPITSDTTKLQSE